jgi:hypothetical protein
MSDTVSEGRMKNPTGRHGGRSGDTDAGDSGRASPVRSHDASFLGLLRSYIFGKRALRLRHNGEVRRIERQIEHVDALCGLKVSGIDPGFIVVQDGLAERELDPRNALRQMHLTTRLMVEEAARALGGVGQVYEDNLRFRLARVERLSRLVNRQHDMLVADDGLASRLGITPRQAMGYVKATAALEGAAGAAAALARQDSGGITSGHRAGIRRLGTEAVNNLDSAFFGAFLGQNTGHADRVLGALGSTRAGLRELAMGCDEGDSRGAGPCGALPEIVERLDRICLSAEEIALAMHLA